MTEGRPLERAPSGGTAAQPTCRLPGFAHTDEFLAILAHELRNPLSAIHNAVHLIDVEHTTPERLAWLRGLLERQIQQLVRLIDDLLDASRVKSGRIRLKRRLLDLGDAVRDAVDSVRPLIDERRHALTVELPEEPVTVDADHVRIAQAVSNLLINAATYTPDGGQIRVLLETSGPEEPPAAIVRVRDNGAGIESDRLERVFEPFAKAPVPGSAPGLGIGLALVRGLVELHGGSVSARSDGLGRGSEFALRLPLVHDRRPAPPKALGRRPALPALRVLIVDDNVDTATALALHLHERGGHTVRVAHTGSDGLAAAHEFGPQIVLLDIGLPDIDGYEVARRLRKDPVLGALPVVALTGYGGDHARTRALDAGFTDYLVKPVPYEVLNGVLAKRTTRIA